MSGFGSFSPEAYEQLRQAYSDQLQRAEEVEEAGVQIGQDNLGVETAPVRSDWLDKTGLWKYPDGRGERQDVEQRQQDLLAALRDENGDLPADEAEGEDDLDGMTDEEIEAMIDEILDDIDEGETEDTDGDAESDEGDELTDEEFEALLDQILAEVDDELAESADLDDEEEADEPDADDIAARIAELKAELAALTEGDEEDYEPEETQGEEEETEPEVPENDTEEEDPSDDEPN